MVVRGVPSVVVRAVTKQISFVTFARFEVELKIVLGKLYLPGGGTGSNFMGLSPISEVFMVGPNDDG